MAHQSHPGGRGEGESPALSAGGETIAAIATPAGRGGIGIVRVSGPGARTVAAAVTGTLPAPRLATHADFRSADGSLIDQGIALFFAAPHSYTGEDVLELQGHGGPLVMQQLLRRCCELGARIAQPGEFTRRAFLNERIDLAQAESVADLIDAASEEAARSAARSLAGEFSRRVDAISEAIMELRMHVEACIDFPEEEIDVAARSEQAARLRAVREGLEALLAEARQGAILRDGLTVVLAGKPNVGKSSLLNRLAGDDVAIVTAIPGTTRDYVRATIALEGVPIHLVDTAGLRETSDEVERIGVERTWKAIEGAGAAIFVESAVDGDSRDPSMLERFPGSVPRLRAMNKIDLAAAPIDPEPGVLQVSAKTGAGIDALRQWLLGAAGWAPHGEGLFLARQRHLDALEEALRYVVNAEMSIQAFDLMAEELRLAQRALGRITGEVSADELLGQIFSRFCIGK